MKRLAPIFLLAGLIWLSACRGDLTPEQLTLAVQTLTAQAYTPTATPTPDPDESAIVLLLNRGLAETADPLSLAIDARYQVMDVSFPSDAEGIPTAFRVDIRCECAGASPCCTPERAFIALTNAMQTVADKVARQTPATVISLQAVCSDRAAQIGMMIASWADMLAYFRGTINGFQLGARVVKLAAP